MCDSFRMCEAGNAQRAGGFCADGNSLRGIVKESAGFSKKSSEEFTTKSRRHEAVLNVLDLQSKSALFASRF